MPKVLNFRTNYRKILLRELTRFEYGFVFIPPLIGVDARFKAITKLEDTFVENVLSKLGG